MTFPLTESDGKPRRYRFYGLAKKLVENSNPETAARFAARFTLSVFPDMHPSPNPQDRTWLNLSVFLDAVMYEAYKAYLPPAGDTEQHTTIGCEGTIRMTQGTSQTFYSLSNARLYVELQAPTRLQDQAAQGERPAAGRAVPATVTPTPLSAALEGQLAAIVGSEIGHEVLFTLIRTQFAGRISTKSENFIAQFTDELATQVIAAVRVHIEQLVAEEAKWCQQQQIEYKTALRAEITNYKPGVLVSALALDDLLTALLVFRQLRDHHAGAMTL